MLIKILNTEKNKLWWPKLVGKTINQIQFNEVKFNCFVDIEVIPTLGFPQDI